MTTQTTTFTVAQYAKALSKLPMHYLCLEYTDLKHIVFQGQIIVAHGTLPPMIFNKGKWDEMTINTEHGMVMYDPSEN